MITSVFHLVKTDEDEDGSKLVFRATNMIKRNCAIEGLYNAFKNRRRDKSNSTTKYSSSLFR